MSNTLNRKYASKMSMVGKISDEMIIFRMQITSVSNEF